MILAIKVIPGARKNSFKMDSGRIKVHLTAPALDGRANAALVDFLAEHFEVRSSRIEIIKGLKSRDKIVSIIDL